MDQSVSRELAHRDLADIRSLKESGAFERYFVRRVKKKRDDALQKLVSDDSLSHEQREVTRTQVKLYNELLSMLDLDESSCQRMIQSSST